MRAEEIVRIGEKLKEEVKDMNLPHAMRYVGDFLDDYPEDSPENTLIAALALNVGLMSEKMMFDFISSEAKESNCELVLVVKSYFVEDGLDYAPIRIDAIYDYGLPIEERRKFWALKTSVQKVVELFDTDRIYGYIHEYTHEYYSWTNKVWKFNPDGTIEEHYKGDY